MADEILQAGATIDVSPMVGGLNEVASQTRSTADSVVADFGRMEAASKTVPATTEHSFTEARHAIHGLGEEIGVRVPRFVQSFLSQLGGVGPVMAAAFTPIAVVGLIEVLSEVPEAFERIIDKVVGFKEEIRKAYADAVKENIEFQKANVELAEKLEAVQLIGKQGADRATLALELQKKSTADLAGLAKTLQLQIDQTTKSIEQHISGWQVLGQAISSPTFIGMAAQWSKQTENVDELKRHLEDLRASLSQVTKQLQFEAPVKLATDTAEQKEAIKRDAEEAERHQIDLWNQEVEENRRRILAELHDDERAAREQISIMEEQAKINKEFNKNIDKEIEEADKAKAKAETEVLDEVLHKMRENTKEQERLAKESLRPWIELGRGIERGFDSMVQGVLTGTQTVGQAVGRLATNMLVVITESLAKILLKHVAHWAAVHILEQVSQTQSLGILIAGATAKRTAQTTENVSAITSDAGKAGAAGFASVMEALPFPENVATAPGVMADAIAETLGNLGMAAAARGGVLSSDQMVFAHRDEMILPPPISRGLQTVIQQGGAGAGPTVHFSPTIHAIDAKGVREVLNEHMDAFVSVLRRAQRENRI